MGRKPDILLLATADWDHPLWTNKQHVACSLAARGHRVLYVESLGLRAIQPTGRDWSRVWKRLLRAFQSPRPVRPGIWVCSPLVLPGVTQGPLYRLNRWLLNATLAWMRLRLGLQRPWLWTYSPLTLKFLDPEQFSLCVYHAVDAVQEQPCMPRGVIERQERLLCAAVDQVFVTSPQLRRQLTPVSRRLRFDPNVVDQEHFATAMAFDKKDLPSDLAAIPEPRIGFIGAISTYKLDVALVAAIAGAHPSLNFVFIGPQGEGEMSTDLSLWKDRPNIHLLGPRPYQELPGYCAGFQCGWLPLQRNAYTQAMFPMKFFEYLAAGLPVVATSIDALQEFQSAAWLCEPEQNAFSKALVGCIQGEGPARSVRLALARQHTYTARTERMMQTLREGDCCERDHNIQNQHLDGVHEPSDSPQAVRATSVCTVSA